MIKLFQRAQKNVALPPGTVVYHGVPKMDRPRISVIAYGQEKIEERYDISLDEALDSLGSNEITWLNIDGLHDTDMLMKLGEPVSDNPTPELLQEIHQLKRDVIYRRKRIVPVREVIDRLIRSD